MTMEIRPPAQMLMASTCSTLAGVSVLNAEGGSELERLASLIAVPDFASVYLALLHGLDPIAVRAVSELKERTNA